MRTSFGDLRHQTFSTTGGPTLDDETGATKYKLQFESTKSTAGAGVQLEFMTVDDDLHSSVAGVAATDTNEFDLFGHFTARPKGGDLFRMPIRVGPFFSTLNQEFSGTTAVDLTYMTFGVRLEIEPEIDVFVRDDMVVSVFAGGRVGVGLALVGFDSGPVDEDFTTTEFHLGFQGGARFRIAKFNIETGYVYQRRTFDESDPELFGATLSVINEADFTFNGFFISAGIRW